jgi:hypothetical protein
MSIDRERASSRSALGADEGVRAPSIAAPYPE